MKKFSFRKRLCYSTIAALSMFAVCSIHLHAASHDGAGEVLFAVNDSPQSPQEVKVGEKTPDFTFTKDGQSVKISDFEYYYVILNFSSSSPASSKVNADMVKLAEQYKDSDAVFVTISIDEYADVANQYGVSSAPTICIIKPDGTIHSIESGNIDLTKTLKYVFGI